MINRRIIRIKALHILYAYYTSPDKSINNSEKELFYSIQKTYDLYHLLLDLAIEVQKYACERIEINRQKHRPSYEDLHPNMKFANNPVIKKLAEDAKLQEYLEKNKLGWVNHPGLIRKLFKFLTETDLYNQYLSNEETLFEDDIRFADKFFSKILLNFEELFIHLEEQSIYWNDDVEFVLSMISKTLRQAKNSTTFSPALFPMFRDDEDHEFAKNLFRKAVLNHSANKEIIEEHLKNWDIERIAFMDILIMELAIVEFTEMTSVPTKVTLNEYIEISKFYSTTRSSTFINGILDKILKSLRSQDRVKKAGRGLVGE